MHLTIPIDLSFHVLSNDTIFVILPAIFGSTQAPQRRWMEKSMEFSKNPEHYPRDASFFFSKFTLDIYLQSLSLPIVCVLVSTSN